MNQIVVKRNELQRLRRPHFYFPKCNRQGQLGMTSRLPRFLTPRVPRPRTPHLAPLLRGGREKGLGNRLRVATNNKCNHVKQWQIGYTVPEERLSDGPGGISACLPGTGKKEEIRWQVGYRVRRVLLATIKVSEWDEIPGRHKCRSLGNGGESSAVVREIREHLRGVRAEALCGSDRPA